jgi:hypothetical protein
VLLSVANEAEACAHIAPYARWLSTVGTDDAQSAKAWRALGASRVCAPGEMQHPPLCRTHDGVDWLRETFLSASS